MSAAELELLLRRVIGEGIQLHPAVYLLIALVSLLGGTLGAFVGAYARRRGENLATKADFNSLMEQLRLQTEETERIKSEIARAGWIHQRRWDLKRELYWQLLQLLEEIRQKGRWLAQSLGDGWRPSFETQSSIELFTKNMVERGTVDKLLACKGVAGMILTPQTDAALDHLSRLYNDMLDALIRSNRPVAEAFFDYGRQFDNLLYETDAVYSLVLSESQMDLLGGTEMKST
ncbi:MAG TPA: hypothetical protein VH583_24495 [Vicinamibacterales bacterium]|jgi:hypothetical protein